MIAAQRETTLFPPLLPERVSSQPGGRVIRALIVDDSPRFRVELRGLLELENIQVVGEAGNGWEALTLAETLNPDIILMDQNMPALSGIDATRRIKQARPDRRVVVRRVALTLGGLAVFALILVVFPLPAEWFPGLALILASFSLVLYLIGGD